MRILRPTAVIILASMLLAASIGVTINFHLCGGEIRSMALFVKAKPCSDKQKPCHGPDHNDRKNGCCEEQSLILKGNETQAGVIVPLLLTPAFNLIAVLLPIAPYFRNFESDVPANWYIQYKPPLPERNIVTFLHSFII